MNLPAASGTSLEETVNKAMPANHATEYRVHSVIYEARHTACHAVIRTCMSQAGCNRIHACPYFDKLLQFVMVICVQKEFLAALKTLLCAAEHGIGAPSFASH